MTITLNEFMSQLPDAERTAVEKRTAELAEEARIARVFDQLRAVDHEALFLIRKGDDRALREPWSGQLQNFVMLGLVELEPTLTEAGHAVLRKVVEARKAAGR